MHVHIPIKERESNSTNSMRKSSSILLPESTLISPKTIIEDDPQDDGGFLRKYVAGREF